MGKFFILFSVSYILRCVLFIIIWLMVNLLKMFFWFFLFRDVDKVHDLMDEVAEQQEIANEIGEAISNPVSFGQDVDEVSVEL